MGSLTRALSRLESAQIDTTAQMTARLDSVEDKLNKLLEDVADEQTFRSGDQLAHTNSSIVFAGSLCMTWCWDN